jgi:hypothetical protein
MALVLKLNLCMVLAPVKDIKRAPKDLLALCKERGDGINHFHMKSILYAEIKSHILFFLYTLHIPIPILRTI